VICLSERARYQKNFVFMRVLAGIIADEKNLEFGTVK